MPYGLKDIPRTEFGGDFLVRAADMDPLAAINSMAPATFLPSKIGLPYINKTGSTINAGQLLYVSGQDATSGLPSVSLAVNNVQGAFAKFVAQAAVLNNAQGLMGEQFTLTGQNTNAGNVGDMVYLSSTPGGYTLTKPGSGAFTFAQVVGRILVKSASVGQVDLALFYNLSPIAIGANELSANLVLERPQGSRLIATTGTTKIPILVVKTGVVSGLRVSPVDALATSDTNYISFSVVNVTQSNTMSLDNTGGRNTTKATGGAALVADTAYGITPLTPPNALMNVTAGDQINLICAVTGTLANTVYAAFSVGQVVF